MVSAPEHQNKPEHRRISQDHRTARDRKPPGREGNVSYDFGAVSDTDFAFIERWESQALLEKHMGTEHLQKAVAAWGAATLLRAGRSHRQLPLKQR